MPSTPLRLRNLRRNTAPDQTDSRMPEDPWLHLDPDPYGAELSRGARVWKVYVGEADKQDKELINGWNDSLDVLLVFAALFSAVSAGLLIESSSMLKEDPNDVSAAALRMISQALFAGTNQTSANPTASQNSTLPDFVPSQNAVIVNTLWYMSLSLSVATSFLAVLAKDWCHSFGANRTGHLQDQALRRQRKWRMIQRWKLQELISALPLLMHLSLFLFAIGLCFYIWELNRQVAIPVFSIFGAVFLLYFSTSITAAFSKDSPYATILTKVLRSRFMRAVYVIIYVLVMIAVLICCLGVWLASAAFTFIMGLIFFKYNISTFFFLFGILLVLEIPILLPWWLVLTVDKLHRGRYAKSWQDVYWIPFDKQSKALLKLIPASQNPKELFDFLFDLKKPSFLAWLLKKYHALQPTELTEKHTISLALNWLIENCETPSAVNIALQSIAGASQNVDKQPLIDSQATVQILQRMVSSDTSNKENGSIILYKRALQFLGSGSGNAVDVDSTQDSDMGAMFWYLNLQSERHIAEIIKSSGNAIESRFQPSLHNLEAIEIGSAAPSQILRYFTEPGEIEMVALNKVVKLLRNHSAADSKTRLHPAAVQSLASTIGLHAACLTGFNRKLSSQLVDLCIKTCQLPVTAGDSRASEPGTDSEAKATALLVICALLIGRDRSSKRNKSSLEPLPRAHIKTRMAALDKIYTSNPSYHTKIIYIGLSEILSNPCQYGLNRSPYDSSLDILKDEYHERLLRSYGNSRNEDFTLFFGEIIERHESELLTAIEDVYGILGVDGFEVTPRPPPMVYYFVAAQICKATSRKQRCNALISRFGFLRPSKDILASLSPDFSDHTLELLVGLPLLDIVSPWISPAKNSLNTIFRIHSDTIFRTYSNPQSDPPARYFSATQIWLLLQFVDNSQEKLVGIIESKAGFLPRDGAPRLQKDLEDYIMSTPQIGGEDLDVYSARILECILEARRESSNEAIQRYLEKLDGVPKCIRGLSSLDQEGVYSHVDDGDHASLSTRSGLSEQDAPCDQVDGAIHNSPSSSRSGSEQHTDTAHVAIKVLPE